MCDTAPQVVWEDVQVDFSSGMVEDSSAMYRWFVQRRGVVKNLSLVVETGTSQRVRSCRQTSIIPTAGRCLPLAAALQPCLPLTHLPVMEPADEDWMSAHLVLGLLAGTLEQLTVQAGHEG